jgi:hypothetical protein
MRTGRGLPWIAAVLLASCGGSSKTSTTTSSDAAGDHRDAAVAVLDASDAGSPVAEACAQIHAATVAAMVLCYGGGATDWQAFYDSFDSCAYFVRDVAAGTIAFDPQALPGCLQELATSPCAAPTQCEYTEVMRGSVVAGQHCADNYVCAGGGDCPPGGCNEACEMGVGLGESCASTFCGEGTCLNGVCTRLATLGEACGNSTGDIYCAPPLYCDVGAAVGAAKGTCAKVVDGGVCYADWDCIPTQFCLAGTCTPRRPLGAGCADATTSCETWSVCDTTSATPTCVHGGKVGEPCADAPGSNVATICFSPGYCNARSFTCMTAGQRGGDCSEAPCASGLACSYDTPSTCGNCPGTDAGPSALWP